LRPGLGLGRFGPGRPGLVSGLAPIKLKNLNYSFLLVFGMIETKFRALLSIFDNFDHLSGEKNFKNFTTTFREILDPI
jgi:hypothetical protein